MDYLMLEDFLLTKRDQTKWKKDNSWKDELKLEKWGLSSPSCQKCR